jgi:hypothetical protein
MDTLSRMCLCCLSTFEEELRNQLKCIQKYYVAPLPELESYWLTVGTGPLLGRGARFHVHMYGSIKKATRRYHEVIIDLICCEKLRSTDPWRSLRTVELNCVRYSPSKFDKYRHVSKLLSYTHNPERPYDQGNEFAKFWKEPTSEEFWVVVWDKGLQKESRCHGFSRGCRCMAQYGKNVRDPIARFTSRTDASRAFAHEKYAIMRGDGEGYLRAGLFRVSNDHNHHANMMFSIRPSGDPLNVFGRGQEIEVFNLQQELKSRQSREKRELLKRQKVANSAAAASRNRHLTAVIYGDDEYSLDFQVELVASFAPACALVRLALASRSALALVLRETALRVAKVDHSTWNPMSLTFLGHANVASSHSLLTRLEGAPSWLRRYEAAVLHGDSITKAYRAAGGRTPYNTMNSPQELWFARNKAEALQRLNSNDKGVADKLTWQQRLFCATEPALASALPGQHWNLNDLRSLSRLVENSKNRAEDIARAFLDHADAERKAALRHSSSLSLASSASLSLPLRSLPPALPVFKAALLPPLSLTLSTRPQAEIVKVIKAVFLFKRTAQAEAAGNAGKAWRLPWSAEGRHHSVLLLGHEEPWARSEAAAAAKVAAKAKVEAEALAVVQSRKERLFRFFPPVPKAATKLEAAEAGAGTQDALQTALH